MAGSGKKGGVWKWLLAGIVIFVISAVAVFGILTVLRRNSAGDDARKSARVERDRRSERPGKAEDGEEKPGADEKDEAPGKNEASGKDETSGKDKASEKEKDPENAETAEDGKASGNGEDRQNDGEAENGEAPENADNAENGGSQETAGAAGEGGTGAAAAGKGGTGAPKTKGAGDSEGTGLAPVNVPRSLPRPSFLKVAGRIDMAAGAGASTGSGGGSGSGLSAGAGASSGSGAVPASEDITASVPEMKVETGFGNVVNFSDYHFSEEELGQLKEYGFTMKDSWTSEFYEVYEDNRYLIMPNFVTVDSLMHTYHLYFAYLQKTTEREALYEKLVSLSRSMLEKSEEQYEALKGTEWESAAFRNMTFFTVGQMLLEPDRKVSNDALDAAETELERISSASGIEYSSMFENQMEDYTQYIVRGYYSGDEKLERYFRAMMWYGRQNFAWKEEDADRSALLMTLALEGDALKEWETIYTVTSFFAGSSDDSGYYEYRPIIDEAYGEDVRAEDLPGKDEEFEKYRSLTQYAKAPRINSVPVMDTGADTDHVLENAGYRFMGQRFSVDAAAFQQLIYNKVTENGSGDRRMLPDTLDIPAVFGSDEALDILEERGNMDYAGYAEQIEKLRMEIAEAPEEFWNANLSVSWINTLRPLLTVKGTGYPYFMQNQAWRRKTLETFLSSYAELKHDTVLYQKQVLPEMGGGDLPDRDDRGYVEPEPEVYTRFTELAEQTRDGLEHYGLLDGTSREDLSRLAELSDRLRVISEKELRDELLSDEEYDLIREYGGDLEHFWRDAYRDEEEKLGYLDSRELPAPVITDIATNPDAGTVLQIGTGKLMEITVAVPFGGSLKLCSGSAYCFHEFEHPADDRLTDTKWREMLGVLRTPYGEEPPVLPDDTETATQYEDWTKLYKREPVD